MTETTWAGRSATPPRPEDDDRRSRWVPIAGAIALLALVGGGGFLLGSVGDDDAIDAQGGVPVSDTTIVEADTSQPEQTSTSTEPATTAPSTTAPSTTAPSTTAPSTTETTAPVDDPEEVVVTVAEGDTRAAVLRGGVLYLGGSVPSREVADQIIERAAAVVGEDKIVDQYVIDPNSPVPTGAPLYVDDVVLFAYGSPTFDPQFTPLLDLGLLLLSQNPQVTVTVVTHTDASGSEAFNQELSFKRGQSVAQYWVDRGIPAEQIIIDARGEREPIASNDNAEGAQMNRRAEFFIEGLLG